jgi:hypothetical protein
MSIVTLKRKTLAKYNNNSANSPDGFSLNGTHRSQGYIGQTSLSRSFPRTPMKGNVAKGYGGCCGKYQQGHIIQSGVTSMEDPTIVKSSALSTRGLIDTKYRWIRRPQPYVTVQKFYRINTQSDYITHIRQKTLSEKNADGTPCHTIDAEPLSAGECGGLSNTQMPTKCHKSMVSKPAEKTGAITGEEHIIKLDKKCTQNDVYKPNTAVHRAPVACGW